jgi:hypothetical protein
MGLTIYDVAEEFLSVWDWPHLAYISVEACIRELFAFNDPLEIALVFNGEEVKPAFNRRTGTRVALDGT